MGVKINDHIIQMTVPWGRGYYSDSFCNYRYSIIDDFFKVGFFFSIWIYFILRGFRSVGFHVEEERRRCYLGHYISTYYTFTSDFFLVCFSNVFKNREEAIWPLFWRRTGVGVVSIVLLFLVKQKKKTFKNNPPIFNHYILSHRSLWIFFHPGSIT